MKRLIAAVLLAPVLVLGQGYPNKPVKMIIPFAPGGASDFVGRIIQPNLSEVLGQQVVIENRPGASGNIGVEAAARSAPEATPSSSVTSVRSRSTRACSPSSPPIRSRTWSR